MTRQFTSTPSSQVTAAVSNISSITIDETAIWDMANNLQNGEYIDTTEGREDEVDWDDYWSVEDMAQDVSMILYVMYGLQDGEDYQLMNEVSIMPTDPTDPRWEQVQEELGEK